MNITNYHISSRRATIMSGLFAIFLISCLGSCKKFVEIPPSRSQITNQAVFVDSTNATAAVLGMYIYMISGVQESSVSSPFSGQVTIYTGLSSDELYTTDPSSEDGQFYQNSINVNNGTIQSLWDNFYTVIYQANAIIEGVTASTGISAPVKNQLIGESKMVRAMNYFYMINLFGGAPLVLSTDYKTTGSLPRSTTAGVYTQIISDLTDAQAEMSAKYVTSGKVRPNKYAAEALLAKAYLYQQQWAKAEAAATDVIDHSGSSLNTNLNDVFLANSDEAIWQLQPVIQGSETPEGVTFIPGYTGATPIYGITDTLLNSFEPGDQRKTNWITSTDADDGTTYYYPFKYKLGQDQSSALVEYYTLFRLGEQYLIRAEARAEQNNLNGGLADLNRIRERAGLTDDAAASQEVLLQQIMHERKVELFCELGNRWYDLKRTGEVNTVMQAICTAKGGTWKSDWRLYPLPLIELQRNPFLKQNPGY